MWVCFSISLYFSQIACICPLSDKFATRKHFCILMLILLEEVGLGRDALGLKRQNQNIMLEANPPKYVIGVWADRNFRRKQRSFVPWSKGGVSSTL